MLSLKIKNSKNKTLLFSILLFFSIFLFSLNVRATTDKNDSNAVKLEEGFAEKYAEFIKNQAPSTVFNGAGSTNWQEVIPPYLPEVASFGLHIEGKQSYLPGQELREIGRASCRERV